FFCRLFPPSFSYLLPPLLSLQLFFLLRSFSSTSIMATAAPPPSVAGVARLSLPLRLLQDWSCVNGGGVLIIVVTVVG
ncbi:hypothetical protein LINGRAHAP2_LOCUS36655, partial [Linum grandiflorum]